MELVNVSLVDRRHFYPRFHGERPVHSALECRKLAKQYEDQGKVPGISRRMATVLTNISRSFSGLATQFELLGVIAADENKQSRNN